MTHLPSLPTRGAWIEISSPFCGNIFGYFCCRSPHGERGLKFLPPAFHREGKRRSPHGERGLKSDIPRTSADTQCRSPHGERGLKYICQNIQVIHLSRSPHGERGLKCIAVDRNYQAKESLPTRGAWIEPHGERGLKSFDPIRGHNTCGSLPTRGAWIEIASFPAAALCRQVAPHTGSVD